MTLKQSQKDYIKINRALEKSRFWSCTLSRYGETDEEKAALREIWKQILELQLTLDKAMAAPMGRLLQRSL